MFRSLSQSSFWTESPKPREYVGVLAKPPFISKIAGYLQIVISNVLQGAKIFFIIGKTLQDCASKLLLILFQLSMLIISVDIIPGLADCALAMRIVNISVESK